MRFSPRRFLPTLRPSYWIFAGALLVRVITLARLTSSPFLLPLRGDMHFYDDWAQRILHGQLTDHLAFYGLPLYAYLLALIYAVVGYGPFIPGLIQACVDAGTAVVLYKLGVHVFSRTDTQQEANAELPPACSRRGHVVGGLAALGWIFFTPAQTYAVILMPTVWFIFTFWFVVWQIARSRTAVSARQALGYGALIGVAATGVATIFVLVPLVIAAIFFKPPAQIHSALVGRLLAAALLLAGIGAGTAPCWIHNYFIAHDPVLISAHDGVNVWVGNNPQATGYPHFPPGLRAGQEAMLKDSITAAERAAGRHLKRSEVSAYWSGQARQYINANFTRWLKLLGTKVKNFWSAFQYDDLSMITALREHGIVWPALRFGLVSALAIPGILFAWRRQPASRWVAAAVLLQMLALLPVFITERYRLPAVPGLLLFAAFGLSILWTACLQHESRAIGVYLGLLALWSCAVSWPIKDRSLWALDNYNSGWQALESGDLALAEQKLQLAYSYVPDNAETNFAVGNLRLAQGKTSEAKTRYFATLQLDPTHEGAYNNLGVVALQEQRWNLAARFFEKALNQDPRDPKTHYLLAQAQFRSGDLLHAKDEIAEALKLNPTRPEFAELLRQIEEKLE